MEYKKLTNTSIPIIGLGSWKLKGEECKEIVKQAIKLGYNHIDTAQAYENEKEIGQAIKESKLNREEIFITTKVWPDNLNKKTLIKSLDDSLKNLKTKYIDLYLLHWPQKKLNYKKIFQTLKEQKDKGKIRAIGVSNFTINHLKEIIPITQDIGTEIEINQVELHPLLYQKELIKYCYKNNILIEAYSPLARGQVLKEKTLINLSKKYNKSPAQISLSWLIDKGIIVIPKASNEKHLIENLESLNLELDSKDIEKINKINKNKRIINPTFAEFDY